MVSKGPFVGAGLGVSGSRERETSYESCRNGGRCREGLGSEWWDGAGEGPLNRPKVLFREEIKVRLHVVGTCPPFTVCNSWFNPFPAPLTPTLCGRYPPSSPTPFAEKTGAQQGTFSSWVLQRVRPQGGPGAHTSCHGGSPSLRPRVGSGRGASSLERLGGAKLSQGSGWL